ncbi:hypothetical protein [Alienimonas sp. DA493]|uniref:hypothetical protein n=1 Tax=Alienimonas sp. DA493 TaxID=3373605 RepID=UPI003754CECA
MKSYCVRQGQGEIGVVEHEGRTFACGGASVTGREIAAYTVMDRRKVRLATWCGRIMLDCRNVVTHRYCDGAVAVVFSLTQGRHIVGFALGEHGMLFRGELIEGHDFDEASRQAHALAEYWSERDQEDELSEAD